MEMEKLYRKALRAGFDNVERTADGGLLVEKNSATSRLHGKFNANGEIASIGADPSILAWILGILTFPIGSVVLAVYYLARLGSRKAKLRMMMTGLVD